MFQVVKELIASMKESTKFESEIVSEQLALGFAKERVELLRLERAIKIEFAFAQDAQNRYNSL